MKSGSVRTLRWLFLPLATIIAFISLAVGCSQRSDPLRVATLPWAPYKLINVAAESSRPDLHAVEFIRLQTPSEVVRAFRYELVDAMFVTSHFALSSISELPDTRIIYFIDVSIGGDALVAQPDIQEATRLKGGRVGIEAAPLGSYMLVRALQLLDIDRDDIDVVEIDTPDHYEAFNSGQIDALVTYDPIRSQLIENGANQLFGSEEIPYEIIDVLVTRSSSIDTHSEALTMLVQAIDSGIRSFEGAPEETVRRLTETYGLSEALYMNSLRSVELFDLDRNLELFDDPEGPVRRGLVEQCNVMVDQGLLVSVPDLDPILDSSIVDLATKL